MQMSISLMLRSRRNCLHTNKPKTKRNWFPFSRQKRISSTLLSREKLVSNSSTKSSVRLRWANSTRKYIFCYSDHWSPWWFKQVYPWDSRPSLEQGLERNLGWCPEQVRTRLAWRSGRSRGRPRFPEDVGLNRRQQATQSSLKEKSYSLSQAGQSLTVKTCRGMMMPWWVASQYL